MAAPCLRCEDVAQNFPISVVLHAWASTDQFRPPGVFQRAPKFCHTGVVASLRHDKAPAEIGAAASGSTGQSLSRSAAAAGGCVARRRPRLAFAKACSPASHPTLWGMQHGPDGVAPKGSKGRRRNTNTSRTEAASLDTPLSLACLLRRKQFPRSARPPLRASGHPF